MANPWRAWRPTLICLLLAAASTLDAQVAADWAGVLDFPQNRLNIILHITGRDNDLRATADSPDQNIRGIPVDSITRDDDIIKFRMIALDARFTGEIDGMSIRGTFTQRGVDIPLLLTRSTNASRSSQDSQRSAIAGNWIGTLRMPVGTLRIVLHVNGSDNSLQATVDSPDQGLTGIPVDSITKSGPTLRFSVTALNLSYRGQIETDNIKGIFSQNGYQTELDLRRN